MSITCVVEEIAGIKKNFQKQTVDVYIKLKYQPRNEFIWEDLNGLIDCEKLLEPFEKGIKRLNGESELETDLEIESEEPLEKNIHEVEDVIGVMWNFDYDGIMYYIQWKGWDEEWNKWELKENVTCPVFTDFFQESADFLMKKYEKKKQRQRQGNSKRPISKNGTYGITKMA